MTAPNPLPTLPVSARSAVLSPSAAERTFRTRQFANCLASVPILDLADGLAASFDAAPKPIERPQSIAAIPQRLTRFPDCPLCALNVNDCRCDPDAYAAAVYARRVG